jgi:UDP:flavonoid glycosyltransferase YjiC (YdhE family)
MTGGDMRVLVSSTTGLGHRLPITPLAAEFAERGHEVRWIGGPADMKELVPARIRFTAAGMPERERNVQVLRLMPGIRSLPPPARRSASFSTAFARLAVPSMLEELRQLVDTWRPDVIVHEAAELAAPFVAAANNIPSVCHGFGQVVLEDAMRAAGDVLAPMWEQAGLDPDPYAGSYRGLYVDIYPPSLLGEKMDHVPQVQHSRPAEGPTASGHTVYITFGTAFNQDNLGLVRTAVLGVAAAADEVLVTVGRDVDPAALGDVPARVRVEEFVPQAEVLPRCAAVVCHGGSGTVLAALAHGVPVVCIPQGADQFSNAANVERCGAGLQLLKPSEADVREAVTRVQSETTRAAARAIADEIARMPAIGQVADAVEAHAAG